MVRADCTYSHSGEGLHRFVDPVDDRVYIYTQFEVPDARRVFTTFEQPDLKSVFTFHVTAPDELGRGLQRGHPRARAGGDGAAVWHFPTTKRMSTYITAVVAGEYHEVHDVYEGKHGDIPLGHYCRQSLVEYLDRDEVVKITKQGFAFFEEAFDFPYPFGKYDQLYVPEYNMGAMENAGCVTLRDEYLPRSRQPRSFYEFRCSVILHEMAHMWFGDLVTMKWWDDLWLNESFAEWACYHAEVEATEFTDSWTGFANARKQTGLPAGPDAEHAPDRGGQLRPARGRGQLRHDHLRQGRLGAQAAGGVGRPGPVPRRACSSTSRTTPTATPSSPTCCPRSRSPPAVSSRAGPRSGCRRRASTRSPPSSSWPTTAPTAGSRSARRRRPTGRRCVGTGSASGCTTRSTAGWSVVATWRRTSPAS